MATEIIVRKLYNSFVPVDMVGLDAMEEMQSNGEFKATFTRPRNIKFHKKFFALLNVAFDAWEAPAMEHAGIPVQKNRDRFRKDIIIACGFYETTVNLAGKVRLEAKSIRFDRMDDDEFEKLYSKAIDVILGQVLSNYTREDLDYQVEQILRFT